MDQSATGIRDVLALVRRQMRIIVLCLFVALAAGTLLVFGLRPLYTATALVLVDPGQKNLLQTDNASPNNDEANSLVDSEALLVKSRPTLLSVVSDDGLLADPEFGPQFSLWDRLRIAFHLGTPELPTGEAALQAVIDRLSEALSVSRQGNTFVIQISARSQRPAMAAKLANAVAAAYISNQRQAKIASVLASRNIIQSRIADAGSAVAKSQQAIDAFIADNLNQISAETGRADLLGMQQQLNQLSSEQKALQTQTDTAAASLARSDYAELNKSLQSQALQMLLQQRQALQDSLAQESGSAAQAATRAQLSGLEGKLSSTAAQEIDSLRQQIANNQAKEEQLRQQLRSSVTDATLPSQQLTQLYELQQDSQIARSQYQTLLSRQNDLDAQAFLQVADSRIVSEAVAPLKPSFPSLSFIYLMSAVLGLGVGGGLALLRENYIGGFTSEQQVETVGQLSVVSAIERHKPVRWPSGSTSLAGLIAGAPLSTYSESVRRIQVGVDQALKHFRRSHAGNPEDGAIIMVTSAAPEEGKTTIALSLARAFATSGRRTLLIDGDFRRPGVESQAGDQQAGTLLKELWANADFCNIEELATKDDQSELRLLLAGPVKGIPVETLMSSRSMGQLLAAARRNFDVTIIDTPPAGYIVDAIYLAEDVDLVVLVIRWAGTPQAMVRQVIRSLRASLPEGADVVAVLNQVDRLASSQMAYGAYYARED